MAERARNDKGQLIGDDPSTPEVNEAWVGGTAPSKNAKAKAVNNRKVDKAQKAIAKSAPKNSQRQEHTIYVSAEPQIINRETGLRGTTYKTYWDEDREYNMFSIRPEHVEAFEMHEFFVKGIYIKEE
jgi:hypothetical protein